VGGAAIGIPVLAQEQAFAALRSLQISVAERDGKVFAKFPPGAEEKTITSALPHLILVGINDLDLSAAKAARLPSLDKLTALTTLNLSGVRAATLPSLDKLTALTTLDLSGVQAATLPSLAATLPSLDKLTALKELYLMERGGRDLLNDFTLEQLRARGVIVRM